MGSSRNRTLTQDAFARVKKSTNDGVTRVEIGNLFENLKINIISFM